MTHPPPPPPSSFLPPSETVAPYRHVPPEAREALEQFAPFTPAHAAAVAACVLATALVIVVARRVRPGAGHDGEEHGQDGRATHTIDPAGRVLGALSLGHWVAYQAWWNIPGFSDLSRNLPLHVCDLAGLFAGLALLTGNRALTAILYFWGLGLSTQAFITPIVRAGPIYAEFWLFFESHTLVVGAAAYVLLVRRFRPNYRDLVAAILALLAYGALMIPLDLATGWNYGYVGLGRPEPGTMIDVLGPWPWRLVPIGAMAIGIMVVLWLPWAAASRLAARRSGANR